ncbi:MAG: phosphoglycolate phosphatase [Paracoccaceae bacterium]
MTAIVFDLDGTLVDSAPDIHRSANVALLAEGRPELSIEAITSFIGNGVAVLIRRAMAASGVAGDDVHARMMARFLADYNRAPTELTRCYPAVREALAQLSAKGHRLAVCTNKPEAIARAVLDDLAIGGYFDAVIGGDTTGAHKPDPRPLKAALSALGAPGGLYVGDSETDAETARAGAVPFVLFAEGYRAHSVAEIDPVTSFSDFAELSGIVDSLTDAAAL